MKRLFVLLILVLVAGAWAGQLMIQDSGYVLLAYNQTTVETTLWVFIMALVVSFLLLHALLSLLSNLSFSTAGLQAWRRKRRQRSANHKTLRGLLALTEGDWRRAQRELTRSADDAALPLINYLAAARAANENGQADEADALLQKALHSTPKASLAVELLQAQMQISRGQLQQALSHLQRLKRQEPRNKQVTLLLLEVYQRLDHWQGLADLLPELSRLELLSKTQLQQLEEKTGLALLKQPSQPKGEDKALLGRSLQSSWKSLPAGIRHQPVVIAEYVRQLLEADADSEAESLLNEQLRKHWDEALIGLYGQIKGGKPRKRYEQVQGWLDSHGDSAAMHLALARLSMQQQDWSNADRHYTDALALEGQLEVAAEHARLLRHLGEESRAAQVLSQAIDTLGQMLPEQPLPNPAITHQ